jgi:eukaryotic-like serine/threonine-protein kinase
MTGGEEPPPPGAGEEERTRLLLKSALSEATGGAVAMPKPGPVAKGAQSATVAIGTLINNNYVVREVLKAGGMGEVYRGENLFTGDPVAIKVVLRELAEDEKVGQMFLREARTLSQLSDEAIVRYYNFVKDAGIDRYCLVMEFIEGVTLADHTHQHGGLAREAGMALLRRLARGLDKAHARGVIHRDLSPDNVMLPKGIVADALLIDFGIAKSNLLEESTMAGQFAGKFKYVSPEQLGHFGGEIGPQTDIYGLALLMAAALRGKPLEMGSSIVEAVDARRAIPDLSSLPEAFRPILSWMLEPDPAARIPTMAEVVRLLERPQNIPAKYRAGLSASAGPAILSLPPGQTGGLALPPTARTGPGTLPPAGFTRSPAVPPKVETGKSAAGGPLLLLFAVFLIVMGGALGFAWTQGFFDPPAAIVGAVPASGPVTDPASPTDGPEAFLAGLDLGPCVLAVLAGTGTDDATVHVFSMTGGGVPDLVPAYRTRFGVAPVVKHFVVTDKQCPALDFARSFQGADGVTLAMDSTTVASGDPVAGRVKVPKDSALWLALISPRGGVYKLNQSLSGEVSGEQSFGFGLNLSDGKAAPQLVLAVSSPGPLANAAAARDGAEGEALFPLVAAEMAAGGGRVTIGHVLLVPRPPALPDPLPPG